MTASLLARKGEAAPSLETKRALDWMSDVARDVPRERIVRPPPVTARHIHDAHPQPAPTIKKTRRIVVSLSDCEFERLGIAAVKKGVNRHELVRDTMNDYLARLAADMNGRCACLLAEGSTCCAE
jgi:hypothetical protein